ncbi:hypothetical protein KUCAC02_023883, partial [Chaenocephalus aceratus]
EASQGLTGSDKSGSRHSSALSASPFLLPLPSPPGSGDMASKGIWLFLSSRTQATSSWEPPNPTTIIHMWPTSNLTGKTKGSDLRGRKHNPS